MQGELPPGSAWVDHLDILDVVRRSFYGIRQFHDCFAHKFSGYSARGISPEEMPAEVEGSDGTLAWADLTVPHELISGRVRVATSSMHYFRLNLGLEGVNDALIERAVQEASGIFGLGEVDVTARDALLERATQRPTIAKIASWWAEIPGMQITAVGQMIARANMHRLDPSGELPLPHAEDQGSEPTGPAEPEADPGPNDLY